MSKTEGTLVSQAIIANLQDEVSTLKRENNKLYRLLGTKIKITEEIQQLLRKTHVAPKQPTPLPPAPKKNGKNVTAVTVWSDWHIGEIVKPDQTGLLGEFNYNIAKTRFFNMLETLIKWLNLQRNGYKIPEITVLGLGDYISGMIHDELLITQEFSPAQQVVNAANLLAEGLIHLSKQANSVQFIGLTCDNHGRFFKKPMNKGQGAHNFNLLLYNIAESIVTPYKNIHFKILNGIKEVVTINNYKFLLTHGHTIKSWSGLPWYGLDRFKKKEAETCLNKPNKQFTYIVLGHWHVAGKLPGNILLNGGLTGTSEYSFAQGYYSDPAQIAFLVHPEHGVFNYLELTGN